MLVIRLQRIGKKHQPSYRVVAAEKRSKLGGPPVEDLGSYNPFTKKAAFKNERISHWLSVGAKPTPTVHNLLVKNAVISAPKMKISINKPEAGPVTVPKAVEPSVEAPKESSVEMPIESPIEAPKESPIETLNESLAETSVEPPAETESPAQAEAV